MRGQLIAKHVDNIDNRPLVSICYTYIFNKQFNQSSRKISYMKVILNFITTTPLVTLPSQAINANSRKMYGNVNIIWR